MGGFSDKALASAAGKKSSNRGEKHARTTQWEALAESIVTIHADRFNRVLTTLPDDDFAKIYKDILNYFKPKYSHQVQEQNTTVIRPVHFIHEHRNDPSE